MGRPRKNYICPVCDEQAYLEKKSFRGERYPGDDPPSYFYAVHYNSITKKRNRHYVGDHVDNIDEKQKTENIEQLKQRVKELETTISDRRLEYRYNIQFNEEEIERLKSKLKKSVFRGNSELKFKDTVIPVKYQFFPYPTSNPTLVLDVDISKDVRVSRINKTEIQKSIQGYLMNK